MTADQRLIETGKTGRDTKTPVSFRDQTGTITRDGKHRKWMYPKFIKGRLLTYRQVTAWGLLILLFSSPFIRLNGEQLILMNILERKFVFFGIIFLPQDFYLFVLAMLTFMVFIVLFTVVFGRVWCGWACPQTIFMEMIFRRIEFWIEGDHLKQQKLNAAPLSFHKIAIKTLKHSLFFLISFAIANIFLAYIIGADELLRIVVEPVSAHRAGFAAILVFTIVFYLVFSQLRELVCIVICPYGRLQGVLLDNESLQVAYDYVRGEPRGKLNRADASTGDCVDCKICVDVCPTGIDIRNGSQLECINCTACIDACDMVMDKIHKPRKLIGLKSEEQIKSNKPFKLSKKAYAYAAIWILLLSSFSYLVARRTAIETTIYRASGTLYQQRPGGYISNLYTAELVNKTSGTISFKLEPDDPDVSIQYIDKDSVIAKGEVVKLTFFITCKEASLRGFKSELAINVISKGKRMTQLKTTFIAPYN